MVTQRKSVAGVFTASELILIEISEGRERKSLYRVGRAKCIATATTHTLLSPHCPCAVMVT